jgi:hypothetical protein
MNEENTKKLYENYPKLYMNQLPYGFECGNGWYRLIDRLSNRLEHLIIHEESLNPHQEEQAYAEQVKKKFGELSFYMSRVTDKMYDAIEQACKDSAKICEMCGNDGKIIMINRWPSCLCDNCHQEKKLALRLG